MPSLLTAWPRLIYPLLLLSLSFFGIFIYHRILKSIFYLSTLLLLLLVLLTSSISSTSASTNDLLSYGLVFLSGFILFGSCGYYLSICYESRHVVTFTSHLLFAASIIGYLVLTKDTLTLSTFIDGSVNRWSYVIAEYNPSQLAEITSPNSISATSLALLIFIYYTTLRCSLPFSLALHLVYPFMSVLLVYSLSSRLFLFISLLFCSLSLSKFLNRKTSFLLIFFLASLLTAFAIINHDAIYNFISYVFRLDDAYRGTQSGFSGRTDIWSNLLQLIQKNNDIRFFFGSGILSARQFGLVIDNALIGHYYEFGFLGIFTYLYFLLYPVLSFFQNRGLNHMLFKFKNPLVLTHSLVAMTIISIVYFIIGIFEYRGLSVANALSSVFFISLYSLSFDLSQSNRYKLSSFTKS